MNDKKALKLVEKAIWDWKALHEDFSVAMNHFKTINPEAYRVIVEMAEVESQLIEEADLKLGPLLEKLKRLVLR